MHCKRIAPLNEYAKLFAIVYVGGNTNIVPAPTLNQLNAAVLSSSVHPA